MFQKRRILVFFVDILLIFISYCLSFYLRFDFFIPPNYQETFFRGLWFVLAIKPLVFLVSGMYRSLWSYASVQDALEIFKVITISTVMAVFSIMYMHDFEKFPRSIFILDWCFLIVLVAASRLVWRFYREKYLLIEQIGLRNGKGKRTLIVGAGDAGCLLLKEIRKQRSDEYRVVGFVDDDQSKQRMLLHRVPVLGSIDHLKALVRKHKIEEIIVAIPSAHGKTLKRIVASCEKAKVHVKTLPGISDIIDGKVAVSQIKNVDIEDLLGREPVVLDEAGISGYLTGKKVLVTGAAGSIGSEVCRQVARYKPAKIILFDNAETPLFYIEKELSAGFPDVPIVPVVADVRNRTRIEMVFEEFLPQVVFHAAAYKHVPMMEYNPVEAVTNNIVGTRKLADAAHMFKVDNFVMISTDKAVNPTNVMGASKRAAELYIQSLAPHSGTRFTTVRFGNVLGSNGSVIPIFKEQIAKGGPVTVTHRDVIRYFMTIPEATQLVLQAGCIGKGGEIFVLDMGEPGRIVDLAEELIRLSGFTPYDDIDIVFTGLRPGEKLYEELLVEGEGIKPTAHPKIKVAGAVRVEHGAIAHALGVLHEHACASDIVAIFRELQQLIPEFTPKYSFQGTAPVLFQRVRPDLFPPASVADERKILPLRK